MRVADLHLHTHHSDGIRSPREVIDLAAAHRLDIVCISDHDHLAAYFEILDYAHQKNIVLVPGIELSCGYRGIDVHILAYAFDPSDARIHDRLKEFRESRLRRGEAMVDRLIALGYQITQARVSELCGGGSMGRPHVARALVEAGVVATIDEAFDKLLGPGCPGYVDKARFSVEEAVDLIHSAGGLLSVAHPVVYPDHQNLVVELLDSGVDGIEIFHPDLDADQRRAYQRIAEEHQRMITGGSDDHGFENRQSIGTIRLPESFIAPILERTARLHVR